MLSRCVSSSDERCCGEVDVLRVVRVVDDVLGRSDQGEVVFVGGDAGLKVSDGIGVYSLA